MPSGSILKPYAPPILLVVLGILVYFNSLSNGWVYDDPVYVTENYLIKDFSLFGLKEIFANFYGWDYLPLTLLSFWIDYRLFGLNPEGYHTVNMLLHIANAILLYGLIGRLRQSSMLAFGVALLFVIHPVHVESVAWISERKNVLSLLFFLLSFNSYLDRGPRLPSLLFFLLACLAKTSVVILPLLLLLCDRCFLEKRFIDSLKASVPYLMITAVTVGIALMTHSAGGTIRPHAEDNALYTLFSMIPVFKEYLSKILFPVNLNIWYPSQIFKTPFAFPVLISGAILALFLYAMKASYHRDRTLFFGLAWFVIALLPVSHIIPFPQMMADRFLYIPSIGIFIAGAAVFRDSMRCANFRTRTTLALAVVFILSSFFVLSITRIPVYKDNLSLWRDSIQRDPDNSIAMMYLGVSYSIEGDAEQALDKLDRARKLDPKNIRAAMYMGQILEVQGRLTEAEAIYQEIMRQYPENSAAYMHLGIFYGAHGKPGKALALMDKALSLDPSQGLAHFNRAVILQQVGEAQEALGEFQAAVDQEPGNAFFQFNLGMFYAKNTDRTDLGRVHLQESLRLNPDQAEASRIRATLATLLPA